MGDFGADTLRDSIESAWNLTGRLLKVGSETDVMKEPVFFFGHPQIIAAGEWTKAVEVKKINTDERENIITHPRFFEIQDNYEITIRYRVIGGDETLYDQAEQDVEDMTEEVERIIKTVYDPSTGTGNFFSTNRRWRFDDALDARTSRLELRRVLALQLTRLKSQSTEVFQGFGGVLQFSTLTTGADSEPALNYTYTEAFNVVIQEGYRSLPYLTVNTNNAKGAPEHYRGMFSGRLTCQMYGKKSDMNTATIEALDNIYKAQTGGETADIVFIHETDNTEGTPKKLTTTTTFRPTNMEKTTNDEELVVFRLTGDIIKPTTYAIA